MVRHAVFLFTSVFLLKPVFGQVPFNQFVVFGDSLSDNGNLYIGTGNMTPGPPNYTAGRFTDGTDSVPSTSGPLGVWIEQLAQKMSLPVPVPFYKATGGLNYAVGGAQTGHNPSYSLGAQAIPGLTDQVNLFLGTNSKLPANAAYVFWGGSTDILNNAASATSAATTAVSNIQGNINTLAASGAKYFLWVNEPPLGEIPESITTSNRAALDAASVAFNTAWSSAITQLKAAHPSITIIGIDAYALVELLEQNPSLYGFANVTGSAQGQAVDPNTYLFWDGLHPTTVGHDNIASVAYNTIEHAFGGPAYSCTNTLAPSIASVDSASAYGGFSYFASGSYLEIKGSNLADPTDPRLVTNGGQWAGGDFNGLNAPTMLDGVSVSIDGRAGYVSYISPEQINVQAPEDSATGNVAITVTNCKATSPQFTFAKQTLAPGLLAPASFILGGKQYLVATFNSDGAYVLDTGTGASLGINSRAAKPGDVIIAYGVGFGDVTPSILPGTIVEQGTALNNAVTLSFGSTPATLAYAGLAGSFVGLYEFYITVPAGLASGDYQIEVTQNGVPLPQTFYLTVGN